MAWSQLLQADDTLRILHLNNYGNRNNLYINNSVNPMHLLIAPDAFELLQTVGKEGGDDYWGISYFLCFLLFL